MPSIASLCRRDVASVARTTSVADAARRMRDLHVGALVVTRDNEASSPAVGLITDRDIAVEIVAMGLDANDVRTGEIITRPLVTAQEHDGVRATLARMAQHGVRRMPVLNNHGQVTGLISLDDLVAAVAKDLQHAADVYVREIEQEANKRPAAATPAL